MWRRTTFAALAFAALVHGAARAQDTGKEHDPNQVLPEKIREKLTEQGFRDIKVTPGSFVVSARDKDGQRIMMLIGPTETTMMKMPDEYPSQARTPRNSDDQIIQQ